MDNNSRSEKSWSMPRYQRPLIDLGDGANGDFWDACLNPIPEESVNGFADENFRGVGDAFRGSEEFRDAAEAFAVNRSMLDLQNLGDLELSGVFTENRIPRTDSMSSSGSGNVSADSYFLRRSQNADDMGLPQLMREYELKKELETKRSEDACESRRSTLTKKDIGRATTAEDDRVYKSRLSLSENSSLSSPRTSSIGTVAALEELDRILNDVSSDDEENDSVEPFVAHSTPDSTKMAEKPSLDSFKSFQNRQDNLLREVQDNVLSSLDKQSSGKRSKKKELAWSSPNKSATRPGSARLYIDKIDGNLRQIELETLSIRKENQNRKLDSTLDIDNRGAMVLDKVRNRKSSKTMDSKVIIPSGDTLAEDLFDHKAEEIMRRANTVLARIQQERTIKKTFSSVVSESVPKVRESTHGNTSRQARLPPEPRVPPEPTSAPKPLAEPKSVPQQSPERKVNKSMQTDFASPRTNTSIESLLEQSTYPIGNGSGDDRDVALATRQIFFPPTEIGESSTSKLQIKNYTSVTHELHFSSMTSPFRKRYDTLNIQPRRYVNVPIRFAPTSTGYFQTEISIAVDPARKILKAHMIGEGIPKLKV